jgi:hypothetical protein
MVTADSYDHSYTTAINETCRPDPLSAGGERGGRFATTAACRHGSCAAAGVVIDGRVLFR